MSIKITYRDGRYDPVFICDHCHEEITDADEAVFMYRSVQSELEEVFFVHRGCSNEFSHQDWNWFNWSTFMLYDFPKFINGAPAIENRTIHRIRKQLELFGVNHE